VLSGRLYATELSLHTRTDGDGQKFARLTVELGIEIFSGTGIFGATGSQTAEECRQLKRCVARDACKNRGDCRIRFTHDFKGLTPKDFDPAAGRRDLVAEAIAAGLEEETGGATLHTRAGVPQDLLALPRNGRLVSTDPRSATGIAYPDSICRAYLITNGGGARAAKTRTPLGKAKANARGRVVFRGRLAKQVQRATAKPSQQNSSSALIALYCRSQEQARKQRPVARPISVVNGDPLQRR
jgi:hypothetical protein